MLINEIITEDVRGKSSLSKKLFDFVGTDFSSMEERFLLPISTSVLKRLGADETRSTVFHVTSYNNLDVMIKNQGTQKALSTFFHMNPEKFTSGVATSGGLVFELDANVLLASPEDIESQVDDSGRRWIPLEFMSQNTGQYNTSDLRDDVPELLTQLVKKYTNKNPEDPYVAWKKLGQSLNQKGDNKTLNLLIKDFFDGIYKIYEKHKDEIMKLLRGHLSDRTPMDITNDWDEIISNNYKIKKIHIIDTPELKKNPEIVNGIKSTGIPYDIWSKGSQLGSHVRKTVDKEKAEYIAKQEKDNTKTKSNFVIKSPPGFLWDEFRIFNLAKAGKIDLGNAIAKLSPEDQQWAKMRWQQGLRTADIGKKFNIRQDKAINHYQIIHNKIRQNLGIK
jgi:orotate phosphoribosyltransferase-like protein